MAGFRRLAALRKSLLKFAPPDRAEAAKAEADIAKAREMIASSRQALMRAHGRAMARAETLREIATLEAKLAELLETEPTREAA